MAVQTVMERVKETRDLGYPVYDADGHYYETMDTFRRHLPMSSNLKGLLEGKR